MKPIVLKKLKGRRVALQFPEGLRHRAFEFAKMLEERNGCEVVLLGDACYGACDLPGASMMGDIEADILLHLGHLPFPRTKKKIGRAEVMFLEMEIDIDLDRMFKVILGKQNVKKLGAHVGLATTAQHMHQLKEIKACLKEEGVRAELLKWGSRSLAPGHVVGCSFSGASRFKGYSILFIGTGTFHPLGIALASSAPVFQYDPERCELVEHAGTKDRFLRKRFASIANSQDAKRFGIIVSSKPGQLRKTLAELARKMVEDAGKEAVVVVVDEVRSELLNYMDMDAWINTACPRISLDDSERFKAPVLTFFEAEIALGIRKWGKYEMDSFG